MNNWGFFVIIMSLASFCAATIHKVKSLSNFEHILNNSNYAIVFIYQDSKGDTKHEQQRIDEMFDRLSRKADYVNAHVEFIKINHKNISTIVDDYALTGLPAFVILKKGKIVGSEKERAVLYDYPIRGQLIDFIDQWIGDDIEAEIEAEQSRREREEERSSRDVSISYTIDPYWGYSGYYWDWPYYRPGFYGGFGYHHGWHGGHGGGHRR